MRPTLLSTLDWANLYETMCFNKTQDDEKVQHLIIFVTPSVQTSGFIQHNSCLYELSLSHANLQACSSITEIFFVIWYSYLRYFMYRPQT